VATYEVLTQPVVSSLVVFNRDDDAFFNPVRLGLTGYGFDGYYYADGVQNLSQVASWASEQPSATRGTLINFPTSALVVVSEAVCSIFDTSGGSLVQWMVFYKSDEFSLPTNFYLDSEAASFSPSQVSWGNGVLSLLLIPDSGSTNQASALLSFDFTQDEIYIDTYDSNGPVLFALADTSAFTFVDPAIVASSGTLTTAGTAEVYATQTISGSTATFSLRATMGVSPGSNVGNFIGIANLTTPSVTAAAPPTNIFQVGFNAAGFVYNNVIGGVSTSVTLIPEANLVAGTYEVSVDYLTAGELSITVYPTNNFAAVQLFQLSSVVVPTNLNSFVVNVGGAVDMMAWVGYATGPAGTIFPIPTGFDVTGKYNVIQTPDVGGLMLITAQAYSSVTPSQVFIIEHGFQVTAAATLVTLATNNFIQPILEAGYIVMLIEHANPAPFGNQAAVDEMVTALDLAQLYLNAASEPCLIGIGMGALDCLNFVVWSGVIAVGMVGISPMTNLANAASSSNSAVVTAMETAYNYTGSGGYALASAGYDPSLTSPSRFAELFPTPAAVTFNQRNIILYASEADTVVSYTTNAELFASLVAAELITTTGGHNDPSNYVGSAVLADFDNLFEYGCTFQF
jgi:hypothetical protein